MRPIAVDTADFPSLRNEGRIYVDKTAYMHRLATDRDAKLFFLSRPRRFGKSLTVSAFKALFQARRELFKGLAIDKLPWKWETFPVIHLDLSKVATNDVDVFDQSLTDHLEERLAEAGFNYDRARLPSTNFSNAITKLSKQSGGKVVVILIDEYDAPVGHALNDITKAEAFREHLSNIYIQMKSLDGYIRFLFMTGVSKFTKLSVFSSLNNLVDVSQDDEYATMFGYTEEELSNNFGDHMHEHARLMGKSYEDYRAEMKWWYNGFRFSPDDATTVYNPISVSYTLRNKKPLFRATWSGTGRPSMLMNYLKREDLLSINLDGIDAIDDSEFDVADLRHLSPIGMLYQAGYLTIKDYDPVTEAYTLGVPDEEIRRDLATLMVSVAANETTSWAGTLGKKMLLGQWDAVFEGLQSLYAAMAYGSTERRVHENSYGRCLSFLLASCGFRFTMKAVQANERADIVAEHPAEVCIFELKVDEPVDKAFAQLRAKNYAAPYVASGRPIWLIGLSFDSQTRQLVDFTAERL